MSLTRQLPKLARSVAAAPRSNYSTKIYATAHLSVLSFATPAARLAAASPLRSAVHHQSRFYSPQSLDSPGKEVTYDDVVKLVQEKPANLKIVDTREPEEYAQGHIPGAINVPFRSSPGAFGLDAAEFQETFNAEKPSKDDTLLFYCVKGIRSAGADQLAATYGYKNRLNYAGSMSDWIEKKGELAH